MKQHKVILIGGAFHLTEMMCDVDRRDIVMMEPVRDLKEYDLAPKNYPVECIRLIYRACAQTPSGITIHELLI